jgi:hypothetical protein
LVGWLVGWLVGRSVGRLVSRQVGRLLKGNCGRREQMDMYEELLSCYLFVCVFIVYLTTLFMNLINVNSNHADPSGRAI